MESRLIFRSGGSDGGRGGEGGESGGGCEGGGCVSTRIVELRVRRSWTSPRSIRQRLKSPGVGKLLVSERSPFTFLVTASNETGAFIEHGTPTGVKKAPENSGWDQGVRSGSPGPYT